MGLFKRKFLTFFILLLSVILLVLACITANRACYDQPYGYLYSSINNDNGPFGDDCEYFCNTPAVKLIGTPTSAAITDNLWTFPVGRVVRCPWEHTAKRLFLAVSCLMVLWFSVELFLSSHRRFHFCWNIFGLLTLGLAIPTAIYMINDLYDTDCGPWENRGFKCYSTIFNVSFILLIVAMVAMLFNLIYNLIYRKKLNERDPKYSNIPQQNVPTEAVIVNEPVIINEPVIVNEGIRAPVEDRIA